jgi:shikimate kinase
MNDALHGHKKSLIYLTGFMGSGKSTIGPILANTLGYAYLDVDQFIEQKTKKRIAEIFSSEGEQTFRILERKTLLELAGRGHCVISLGGGTIANEENLRLVSQSGILVYLKLSKEEILQRVQYRNDRPMLKDSQGNTLQGQALENRIQELLTFREQFYSRAEVVINADHMRVGDTVDEIMKNIRSLIQQE